MSVVLPILVNALCVLALLAIIVRQTKRIVDLETALQAQVYARELETDQNVSVHISFDARQVADEIARQALAKQKVL